MTDDEYAAYYNKGRRMDSRMGCETVIVILTLLLLPILFKAVK